MSTKHLRQITVYGVLFCVCITLWWTAIQETPPTIENQTETVKPSLQSHCVDFDIPRVFDAEAFKRTIIDNNLFRPLGWTPPRPKEPYRLLGTIHPTDAHTPKTAILQSTAGHQIYIVSTGDNLDASTEVVSIEGKAVVLSTEGQQRTLRLAIGF